ncbi:hypothetical protein SAMN02745784_02398 [Tissierella praeacuta DSM 18095]|uniref:Uncharacterized protein n=1 Tax=Tissierella praeacuta DSM 18095 TaxID=1123404 RepID=A0A1M4XVA6_9FIRM|nr:hypothetical protein [Tissierella praeacuta]SHE97223.1 hypothetical protein SAMN02745784_02398 [Tissierella praeacuta DSM 18095]SUO99210.1 Uncharacterised protein [Tissierella praeacuta]
MTINLNTRKEREETIWQFQNTLRKYISSIPGIMEFVVKEQGGTATTGSAAPLDISIRGDDQCYCHGRYKKFVRLKVLQYLSERLDKLKLVKKAI